MSSTSRLSWLRRERPVLYGRDRDRARLREILDVTTAGQGLLVLISGEAGIGKTTLVDDLVDEALHQDCLVLAGGCYDLTTTPPYGPWGEAIRGYIPQEGQPSVPPWFGDPDAMAQVGSQATLFDETCRFFAAVAERQPLMIVLEDLHWADSASLEALRYVARTLGDHPVLLVATYREDEVTRRHDLYQLLPILVRESRPQRIHLNPLARHDVWEMVTGRYNLLPAEIERLAVHLSTRSQGNPFFAEEILQGLQDEQVLHPVAGGWKLGNLDETQIPVPLRQALELRLARLSTETRAALRVAAVIGQHVPLELWRDLADLKMECFERVVTEPLEAHVLEETPTGDTLEFRHALLREALYASITLNKRRELHQRVGEALAAKPNAEPDAVAHHFQQAGDSRAAHWLIRAGVRAEGTFAMRVALSHHDTAQALLAADPEAAQGRGWLLYHIGHRLSWIDQERGIAYLEYAAQIARQIDDPVLTAYSQFYHGLLRCFQGDLGIGLAEMERANILLDAVTSAQEQRALQALTTVFPDEIFSHASATSGGGLFKVGRLPGINTETGSYTMWLALAGRFDKATRIGRAFVDQVTAATNDPALIQYVCVHAYGGLFMAAYQFGQPDEFQHWQSLTLEANEAIGDYPHIRGTRLWELRHLISYRTDRPADRRRVAAAMVAAAERAAGTIEGSPPRAFALPLDLIEGRWNLARDLAPLTLGDKQGGTLARQLPVLAFSVLGREQVDEEFAAAVWEEVQEQVPDGPATEPGHKAFSYGIAARQLSADFALDAGNLDEARDWIEALDRWLDWSGAVLGRAKAQLLWARYHHLAGEADTAHQHAERALEYATDPRQPLALIAAHRALGQLETETGHYEEASEHLRASLELAERCEAPYERALTMLALAELAAHCGDKNGTLRLLDEVRVICETLGAERTLTRVTELEAKLQEQPHAATTPFGLTPRELEVLQAVVEGLTDAEAGERLSISTRTVSHHLRSIYGKLEINNRAAAVRIAMEHELV